MVSLKFWQNAFKTHTKERTGILKAERLRDALEDVGELLMCPDCQISSLLPLNLLTYITLRLHGVVVSTPGLKPWAVNAKPSQLFMLPSWVG